MTSLLALSIITSALEIILCDYYYHVREVNSYSQKYIFSFFSTQKPILGSRTVAMAHAIISFLEDNGR